MLLGVDGTAHGVRRRARFFGRNADVPLMVIAVGARPTAIAAALPELAALLERPIVTLERVRVCKRDGAALGTPEPAGPRHGWQKLMVYAGVRRRRGQHAELVRRLRARGRGGRDEPARHLGLPRRPRARTATAPGSCAGASPVVTVVVDTPGERRALVRGLVDELTAETGPRDERARTDRASPGGRVG